jgi:hypothetical protein
MPSVREIIVPPSVGENTILSPVSGLMSFRKEIFLFFSGLFIMGSIIYVKSGVTPFSFTNFSIFSSLIFLSNSEAAFNIRGSR